MNAIRLRDGRVLAWHEFGDGAGVPCLLFPGSSSSGLAGRALDASAVRAGVRLLAIDRPGLGHSDPAPKRRLVDVLRERRREQRIAHQAARAELRGGGARIRLVLGRRDDPDVVGKLRGDPLQHLEPGRIHAVVVGQQDAHRWRAMPPGGSGGKRDRGNQGAAHRLIGHAE